jgi:hypothetical protein
MSRCSWLVLFLLPACGGGGSSKDALADSAEVAEPDLAVVDPGWVYDLSPEAVAKAVPIEQVIVLPTDRPPGLGPDLSAFYPKTEPKKYCIDTPPKDGSDPSCKPLGDLFGCRYLRNPGAIGAWLRPATAILLCFRCQEDPAKPGTCNCTGPSLDKVVDASGESLCVDAIIHDGAGPKKLSSPAEFAGRFSPVEDGAEALAFASFVHGVRHVFDAGDLLSLRPPGDPASTPFRCLTDRTSGTLASPLDDGAFDIQTFRKADPGECPPNAITRVSLRIQADGTPGPASPELICADLGVACP